MSKENSWIQSVYIPKDKPKTKILNVFKDKSYKATRILIVPVDAPEIDPYDKETGRGFMTPNAIIKSGLSSNAKLMFSVLRSFIGYNLGVVFPNEEKLEKAMSKERKANRKALKELQQHNVIRIIKMPYQGHLKNYYCFMPEDKWNLPEPMQFSSSKNSKEKEEEELDNSQIEERCDAYSKDFANEEFVIDKSSEIMADFFDIYDE